jgi:lysine decarboxylase
MLHVGEGGRVDAAAIGRAVRLTRSTSPSSLLLASLDAARRQLAVHGEALLHSTLAASSRVREALGKVPGVELVGEDLVGRPGVAGWDPLRVVVDVRETGVTGFEVAEAMRETYDVQAELATHATVVFILGLGESTEGLERLAGDFEETVLRISRPGTARALVRAPESLQQEVDVTPREAFLGPAEVVPVDDAVGRISCEAIAGYPPGIPALLPGERITDETVAYLRELNSVGARLHGAADSTFQTINVLIES